MPVQLAQPLVSHSALIAGDWQRLGSEKHSQDSASQIFMYKHCQKLYTYNILKLAKRSKISIDMVHHEGNGSCWYFLLLFKKAS